jgi:hypothetical protein
VPVGAENAIRAVELPFWMSEAARRDDRIADTAVTSPQYSCTLNQDVVRNTVIESGSLK